MISAEMSLLGEARFKDCVDCGQSLLLHLLFLFLFFIWNHTHQWLLGFKPAAQISLNRFIANNHIFYGNKNAIFISGTSVPGKKKSCLALLLFIYLLFGCLKYLHCQLSLSIITLLLTLDVFKWLLQSQRLMVLGLWSSIQEGQ